MHSTHAFTHFGKGGGGKMGQCPHFGLSNGPMEGHMVRGSFIMESWWLDDTDQSHHETLLVWRRGGGTWRQPV